MGIIARQSIKSTVIVYIGVILGLLINVFVLPYCLEVAQVGAVRVLLEVSNLASSFIGLSFPYTIMRFFPYFKNEEKKHHGLLFLCTIGTVVGLALFTIVFYLGKDFFISLYQNDSPLFASYAEYILIFGAVIAFFNLLESYTASQMRIVVPKLLKDIFFRIVILSTAFLYFYNFISFDSFLTFQVIAYILAIIFIVFYLKKKGFWFFTTKISFPTKGLSKDILKFNTFVTLSSLGGILAVKIDILMIGLAPSGDYHNGIYTIAVLLASMIELPGKSLGQISGPLIATYMKENNNLGIQKIYKDSSILQLSIAILLFVLIWSNYDNIFSIMPKGDIYKLSKMSFLFLGIAQLFNMATSLNSSILGVSKYYYFGSFSIVLLGILCVYLNFVFIPKYGITGAAIGTAIGSFLYQFAVYLFLRIKMKLNPFTKDTYKPILIGVTILAINYFVPPNGHPILDGIIRSLCIIGLFVFFILKLNTSNYIQSIFDKGITMIKTNIFKLK